MVSTRPPTSKSSSPFSNPLVTVPNAPITIGIIVTCMFHSFFNSQARSRYLSFFSHFFIMIIIIIIIIIIVSDKKLYKCLGNIVLDRNTWNHLITCKNIFLTKKIYINLYNNVYTISWNGSYHITVEIYDFTIEKNKERTMKKRMQ